MPIAPATGQQQRIAIIGAGWAGLACAIELSLAGQQVTLYEAGRHPGGRARGIAGSQPALDNGQHLLVGAYSETLRLLDLIGSTLQIQRQPLTLSAPAKAFRLTLPRLPAPLHLAVGLLTAAGLGWRDKLAAVRLMRSLQASAYRLDHDLSVSALLDRHRQPARLRRLLWEPLCLAALTTAPEHASAQVFANVLRDSLGGARQATDLLLPDGDLSQLFAEPALAYLRQRGSVWQPGTRIKSLCQTDQGWQLHTANVGSETYTEVVIATAPQHAAPLLREHAALSEPLAAIDHFSYEPIATVYLSYPPGPLLPAPMLMLPGPIGQWVFDRRQSGGSDDRLLACVLSAAGPWQTLPDEDLAAALHAELQQTLGPLPPPVWQRTICEQRATFSCRPNLVRPANRTALAGLWLAGDYTAGPYPATLEGAVRSGIQVARHILTGH